MTESNRAFAAGQRLSLKGQLCTIRYVGPVSDKSGDWLGVEWDDTTRGKHNGKHEGIFYFDCRSKSETCASFIRPKQPWDAPQTFLKAVQQKYMPDFHEGENEQVYFSGKQAEEIGFQKFHARQAKLKGIHVLVLDRMRIQHRNTTSEDDEAVAQMCTDITELDLSRNLFETFDEIWSLCRLLQKLRVLTLDGNRFTVASANCLPGIRTLNLESTLLAEVEASLVLRTSVPDVEYVSMANNEYTRLEFFHLTPRISTVDLSGNDFTSFSDVECLSTDPSRLQTLILKRNRISTVTENTESTCQLSVNELDLSYNEIQSMAFFDAMKPDLMPSLRHLRVMGNPLYKSIVSAEGKPLTAADGYMLTIARLPQLEYFNYSQISDKERLNAETYYLSQIASEIANVEEKKRKAVIARHWRYTGLCDEYGEPNIATRSTKDAVDPNTLAGRLIRVTFTLASGMLPDRAERFWSEHVPKSFTTYAILGLVGKRLAQSPLDLRLVLQTNEQDPVAFKEVYDNPQWWDSSDEDAENELQDDWTLREVQLAGSTRALATCTDSHDVTIKIEAMGDCR